MTIFPILVFGFFAVFARAHEKARRSAHRSNLKPIGLEILQRSQEYKAKQRYSFGKEKENLSRLLSTVGIVAAITNSVDTIISRQINSKTPRAQKDLNSRDGPILNFPLSRSPQAMMNLKSFAILVRIADLSKKANNTEYC